MCPSVLLTTRQLYSYIKTLNVCICGAEVTCCCHKPVKLLLGPVDWGRYSRLGSGYPRRWMSGCAKRLAETSSACTFIFPPPYPLFAGTRNSRCDPSSHPYTKPRRVLRYPKANGIIYRLFLLQSGVARYCTYPMLILLVISCCACAVVRGNAVGYTHTNWLQGTTVD